MSEKCLISIIVPIYNVEKYLDRCVESIVNQSYKNLEIILVDDGSPDNCPKMCDEWAKKDKRIRVIHKENGGVSSARNIGISQSSGDYVTFCDGDDIYTDKFSFVIENYVVNDKETQIFSCGITKNGKDISCFTEKSINCKKFEDFLYFVKNDVTICCVAKIIRRDFLLGVNGYFPCGIKSEDFAWCHRLNLHCTRQKLIPISYYIYNDNPYSVTHIFNSRGFYDQLENYERVYRNVQEFEFTEKQKKRLLRYLMFPYLLMFRQVRFARQEDRLKIRKKMIEYRHLLFRPYGLKYNIYYVYVRLFKLCRFGFIICEKVA